VCLSSLSRCCDSMKRTHADRVKGGVRVVIGLHVKDTIYDDRMTICISKSHDVDIA